MRLVPRPLSRLLLTAVVPLALSACGGSSTDGGTADGGAGNAGSGGTSGASGASGAGGGAGSSGSGSGGTAGSSGSSGTGGAGGGGEKCGGRICGAGEVCCNPSCGICVSPGEGCPAIECIDAGGPKPCGPVTCGAGESCCNATCGICVPPGGGCPDIECVPECEAMDARGQGPCAAFFGYAWNGNECVGLGGCSCDGTDCSALFDSVEQCDEAYAQCPRFF